MMIIKNTEHVVWARFAVINSVPSIIACRGIIYEPVIDKFAFVKRIDRNKKTYLLLGLINTIPSQVACCGVIYEPVIDKCMLVKTYLSFECH